MVILRRWILILLALPAVVLAEGEAVNKAPAKMRMSPKLVAETVLKQGPKAQEIDYQFAQMRLALAQVNAQYDWSFSVEADSEHDKSQFFYPFPNIPGATFTRYYTSFDLKKPFSTGTVLGIDYSRISQSADFQLNSPNPFGILPGETQDLFGVTIEQSLLRNFFGRSDRAQIRAAELSYQSQDLQRIDELQQLVMQSLSAFWGAYVSQETLKVALASREHYQKLVAQVRRKTGEGYANSGELAEAEAEFEAQEQRVKISSADYVKRLEDLVTMLKLPRETDLELEASSDIPSVPKLTPVQVDSLRAIKTQQLKVDSAKESVSYANSDSYPDLNFIGKAYTSGLDQDQDASFSALTAGSHPRYFAGLKLAYHFGSNVQAEQILNRESTRNLEETRLGRKKMEQLDQMAQAERTVQAEFAVVDSAKRQKEFRERAVRELSRSYALGRTDIRLLIDAINGQYETQIGLWRAVGNYQIALNEWAALRDELIPNSVIPPRSF